MSKPVTDCALEWFIASVCSHVYLQPILSRIIFAAENAWIALLGDCIPNLSFEYELTVNPLHFVTIIAISSVLLILKVKIEIILKKKKVLNVFSLLSLLLCHEMTK